jgi:uncharacterized membrane protein YjjB (DUF3815 family)
MRLKRLVCCLFSGVCGRLTCAVTGFSRGGPASELAVLVSGLGGRLISRLIDGPPIGRAAGQGWKGKQDTSEDNP